MKRLGIALFLSSFISSAHAVIIDNGLFTTDTDTNLEWLDVTETLGMSFFDVSAELQEGGLYYGWRYATGVEFNTLISNWLGIDPVITETNPYYHAEGVVDLIIPILGDTYDAYIYNLYGVSSDVQAGYSEGSGIAHHATYGFLADGGRDYHFRARISDSREDWGGEDYTSSHYSSDYGGYALANGGSFLVRESISSVPLPAAIWLFIPGLISILGIGRLYKI